MHPFVAEGDGRRRCFSLLRTKFTEIRRAPVSENTERKIKEQFYVCLYVLYVLRRSGGL